jgi:hypothetical protein
MVISGLPVEPDLAQPDIEPGHHGDHQEQQRRLRRAVGELVEIEQVLARDHRHGLGRLAVRRQHIDQVEDAHGVKQAEDHRHHHRRPHQRQRHFEEHLDRVHAVDLGRLIDILGHHLQAREDEQRHEGRGLPDVDDQHRGHRRIGRGRPGDLLADDAEVEEQVVDDAELVVQHPRPHLGRDDRRDGPRDQDGGADDAAPLELGVEHQRHDHPDDGLERHRNDGEAQRIADRVPPRRIDQEPRKYRAPALQRGPAQVILEADEVAAIKVVQRRVGQRKIDRSEQRPAGDDGQCHQHRHQEPHGRGNARLHQLGLDLWLRANDGTGCGFSGHRLPLLQR